MAKNKECKCTQADHKHRLGEKPNHPTVIGLSRSQQVTFFISIWKELSSFGLQRNGLNHKLIAIFLVVLFAI
jgi:hypothetical protein